MLPGYPLFPPFFIVDLIRKPPSQTDRQCLLFIPYYVLYRVKTVYLSSTCVCSYTRVRLQSKLSLMQHLDMIAFIPSNPFLIQNLGTQDTTANVGFPSPKVMVFTIFLQKAHPCMCVDFQLRCHHTNTVLVDLYKRGLILQ